MSEEIKKKAEGCACGTNEEACDCGDTEACGCGCEEDEIVELIDDEGKSMKFFHVATIDYENNWYVFFSPTETTDGVTSDEVVIFKLDADEEGKDVFSPIEDEELLQKVYDEYVKVMDEDEEGEGCSSEGGCSGCSGCGH